MKLRTAIAPAACVAALIPAVCAAQGGTREAGWDFGFDVLYQFSKDISFDGGSRLDVEDDLGVALSFGYRVNSRFELQFSLDWNDVDYSGTLVSASTPNLSVDIEGSMESFVPRVNGIYNFMDGPVTPYVSGGLGWAFIDTNIPTGRADVGCWWDPWWGQICGSYQPTKDVDGFTYQLGAGLRWDVAQTVTLRFAYEKTWIDLNNATSTPGLDQITAGIAWRY